MLYLLIGLVVVVGGVIIAFLVKELRSSMWMMAKPKPQKNDENTIQKVQQASVNEMMAKEAMADLQFKLLNVMKSKLTAPGTAVLCPPGDMIFTEKDGKHTVLGYVDSQNAFGAMLRSRFRATCQYYPDAKMWMVEHITVY